MRQARRALPRPSRHGGLTTHPTQPVGKGLVLKKILSLAFVAMLSLALAAPTYAGRGHGGGSERNTTTFFPLPLDLFAALLRAFSAAELPKG